MAATSRPVKPRGALALAGAMLALAGCARLPSLPLPERPTNIFAAPVTVRGHAVPPEQLAQITPGVSTRADVQALLGSPSHPGTFSDQSWYYISSQSHIRPGRSLAVYDRQVVAIDFTPAGVVSGVRRIGEAEMPRVAFVSRETPTPGTEQTLLQRIFGGVGRVGPMPGAVQGPQAPGPTR